MVKFVVEVSDGYIRERADVDNLEKLMKGADSKDNPLSFFADFVVFSCIEKKIDDDGVNEFVIKFDKDAGKEEISILNKAVSYLAAVAIHHPQESRVVEND